MGKGPFFNRKYWAIATITLRSIYYLITVLWTIHSKTIQGDDEKYFTLIIKCILSFYTKLLKEKKFEFLVKKKMLLLFMRTSSYYYNHKSATPTPAPPPVY